MTRTISPPVAARRRDADPRAAHQPPKHRKPRRHHKPKKPKKPPTAPSAAPPVLGASAHHLVSRFSYGVTPALVADVTRAGSAEAWWEAQLTPSSISDPAADRLVSWWPSLTRGPLELWQRQRDGVEGGWVVMQDYQRWLMLRRITTDRQLAEVMTEFWMNHFNVPVTADSSFTWRFDYDRRIRALALGRFADLLQTAVTHPAMGMYLDNAVSTKDHPNENLGRELLELHTVGRGQYSEDDVKSSARILTGYLVDEWDTFAASYSPADHWTGPVTVMGFHSANTAADGRPVVAAYLDYLAHHRSTAERVATRLAVKFVRDTPSAALIGQLADVYLAHDTAIVPVLRALVASTEFRAAPPKVRDPVEDVIATYRSLQVQVAAPSGADDDDSAAMAILWQANQAGAMPHDWPRPDGPPLDDSSWCSPARLMAATEVHWDLAGGWWPKNGITYRRPVDWLPGRPIRFDDLVDRVSRLLTGVRADATLQKACSQVCSQGAADVITADSDLVKWSFHRLIVTILDSPTHLGR